MKTNTFLGLLFATVLITTSCNNNNCKKCTSCKTKPDVTLCEDDFEKTSDYNDQVSNMVSDGCNCVDK